jgi:ligand-binding sensor domain-containing protein
MPRRIGLRGPILLVVLGLRGLASTQDAVALDPGREIGDYPVDFWQASSGLPQNTVYAILQSRDGYLWVGTRGGLARFDGVRFTTYNRRSHGLRENDVRVLAEGPDGSLWIGTMGGGLSRLAPDDTVTTYTTKEGLPHDQVQALAVGPDGSIWAGTPLGLARLKDGKLTVYHQKHGLPLPRETPFTNVRSLAVDGRGVLWIGCTTGLASLVGERFTNYATIQPGVLDNRIDKVLVDEDRGGLWLANVDVAVHFFKDGHATPLESAEGSGPKIVSDLCLDREGTLWLATSEGLFRYRAGHLESHATSIRQVGARGWVQTVSLRGPTAVLRDHEGSVWVGTSADGLARLRDSVVTTVSVGAADGLDEAVGAVRQDRRGAVWFGQIGAIKRLQDGVLTRFEAPAPGDTDAFEEDRDGVVWAGHTRLGVMRLEGDRFVPVPMEGVRVPSALLATPEGDLWVGMRYNFLARYRQGQVRLYTQADGVPAPEVRALARDSRGAVWVATKQGVAVLEGERFKTYSDQEGLPSRNISDLYVDGQDVVWVATRSGLARIHDGRVTAYTTAQGVPEEYYFRIIEDDLAHLWVTHGRGVLRFAKAELNAIAEGRARLTTSAGYGEESGLKSTTMSDLSQPAAWKTRDGRLWFASARGVAVFDPKAMSRNPPPPPVRVEEIRVDGRPQLFRPRLTFDPGDGNVEVHYTGLSFVAPHEVGFKYKLEGFDRDWIQAGPRRDAYYTKLPPGSYRFVVTARSSDGAWNEAGHGLQFRLRPHWYQTQWFRAALVLLLGAGALTGYRARMREHLRRERELTRRVEEAVGQVKMLRGLLPICASCKKIRDDSGYWNQMESYIAAHSEADFSHGICPDCIRALYPDYPVPSGGGVVRPGGGTTGDAG